MMQFPYDSNKAFLYAHQHLGGMGFTSSADEYALQSITQAFRMLNCSDRSVKHIAWQELFETVSCRHSKDTAVDDLKCIEWLNGCKTGRGSCSTWWVKVREALRHLKTLKLNIKFLLTSKQDLILAIQQDGDNNKVILAADQKKAVCFHLHKFIAVAHWDRWCELLTQGRLATALSKSKRSNHLMNRGRISFSDWFFVTKARNYLLRLNSRPSSQNAGNKACRFCNYKLESQAHVLNHCHLTKVLKRHNEIQDVLIPFLKVNQEWKVMVNSVVEKVDSLDRPDIQLFDSSIKHIYLIDFKTPYDEWG